MKNTRICAFAIALCIPSAASGGIIFQAEAPGAQDTTVAGTSVFTFDSLNAGPLPNTVYDFGGGIVGTYSGIYGRDPNFIFGGAYNTKFITAASDATPGQVVFNIPINYFGLWWAAANSGNVLEFYSGNTLIKSYSTDGATSPFAGLGSGYTGNPNPVADQSQQYAFFNFYGTDGTTFDRIRFWSSSFEHDNHTVRVADVPEGVPEPSSFLLLGGALLALGAIGRHRSRRRG